MRTFTGISALVLAALGGASESAAAPLPAESGAVATADDEALASVRALLDEARAANDAKDRAAARELVARAIDRALLELGGREDKDALALFAQLGAFAQDTGELRSAEKARRRALEICSRTLPDDHPNLQAARGSLASTLNSLRDVAGARALYEKTFEDCSRTLPDDHPDLQKAREGLAVTMRQMGELAGARALYEKVLEVELRTLPDDHPDLQRARQGLAVTIKELGDLDGALALEKKVLEVCTRTLPDDHPYTQAARAGLATTLRKRGDLEGARTLYEKVLEVRARTLPDDHPDLQSARGNVAIVLSLLGDLAGARVLQERVLDVRSRALPDDHPDLQYARGNLAATLASLGDLAGARAMQEKVLEVFSRTLPDDHPDLQLARANLARVVFLLRDFTVARALYEKVLEIRAATLREDHPDLQLARAGVASTLRELGELADARALQESVLEAESRTLPDDDPDLQNARLNLAATLHAVGDVDRARELEEQVLAVRTHTLNDDHPDLQDSRTIVAGRLAARVRTMDGERQGAAERDGERQRCVELVGALCHAQTVAARTALLTSAAREAEARCERIGRSLDISLSIASRLGVAELDRASFVLEETTRAAALGSAMLTRRAANTPRYAELVQELRGRSDELARLVQRDTTSEEFHRARTRREAVQRELVELARDASGGKPSGLDFDCNGLAASLGVHDAIVAYRKYARCNFDAPEEDPVDSLCAFVLRSGGAPPDRALIVRVELGPLAPIEEAVRHWRQAIGVGLERGTSAGVARTDAALVGGERLRQLVFDPLLGALGETERIVVALDDVLHLVSIDSLPLDKEAGRSCVGDRWRIDTRCTLTELLADAPKLPPTGALVSLGGASFNSAPLDPSAEDAAALESVDSEPAHVAKLLRGGPWERGFGPLTYTGLEAREVAALHDEVFGEKSAALVFEKRKASRASLEELAPRARWLHVATHGWFAPESIRSWGEREPIDAKSGLGLRQSSEDQVRGMSPMLLCGLALAGANLPEDAVGRAPGLITADELSTLDLSSCELAVLSACDTNVGERRAGQGVASLQRALQIAGARSVITSLWKVSDEATKELMIDFYRRLWVEAKPKWQALWEAKKALREAKDENGAAKYSTRDWAAWVLTGAPE